MKKDLIRIVSICIPVAIFMIVIGGEGHTSFDLDDEEKLDETANNSASLHDDEEITSVEIKDESQSSKNTLRPKDALPKG